MLHKCSRQKYQAKGRYFPSATVGWFQIKPTGNMAVWKECLTPWLCNTAPTMCIGWGPYASSLSSCSYTEVSSWHKWWLGLQTDVTFEMFQMATIKTSIWSKILWRMTKMYLEEAGTILYCFILEQFSQNPWHTFFILWMLLLSYRLLALWEYMVVRALQIPVPKSVEVTIHATVDHPYLLHLQIWLFHNLLQ